MNFALSITICLFFVGQAGDRTRWEWFLQNAEIAEKRAQDGLRKEAFKLLDEMRLEADKQKREDRALYTQMYKGVCEYHLGDLSRAIKTLKEVEPKEANLVFRHELYRNLGDAYFESGQVKQAESYLQKALDQNAAAKALKFPDDELVRIELRQVQCKLGLGQMKVARQRLEPLKDRIQAQKKKGMEPEVWACLDARWNMLHADLDLDARNPLRALIRLEESQKNLQRFKTYQEALDLQFRCHVALAADYWLLARFSDAGTHLDTAQKIALSKSLPVERNQATLKNARAALLIEKTWLAIEDDPQAEAILADLNEAENSLAKALEHLRKTDSAEDHFTATIDFQLAQVHELRGRALAFRQKAAESRAEWLKAKQHCEKALAWREGVLPADSDLVLEARARHAWVNLRLGDAKAARDEGKDALKLFDKNHKSSDLDRGRYLHVLLEAESRLGNFDEAAKYARQHRRLVDDGLGTVLAGLSASEQIQFFRKWDNVGLNASLRLGIQNAKNDPILAASSVEWLINGKAKLAEILATQVQTAKRNPQGFVKFERSVERQAYLLYGQNVLDTDSLQTDYLFEESIKRDLAEAAAKEFPVQPRWYTLQDVRDNLAQNEIYIGVYSLRPTELAERMYYAWLVPQRGPVQIVPLGDAATIDGLVRVFQREQERVPLIAPGQERRAEQELRDRCLRPLSELILHKIHAVAGGSTRWVVSPDGPLWNVPWAALLLPDGERYAIEELTFRYAVSGRDLAPDVLVKGKSGEPLILGDPRFNYRTTMFGDFRRLGDPLKIPWDRLAYSEEECDTMFTIMTDSKMKPGRHLGLMQKQQLRDVTQSPRILYLSTHAYAPLPSKVPVDDPLLSCALAFAGWNYLPDGHRAKADEALPGMMTGAEVLAADLGGTELVVLASCQTGHEAVGSGQSPANLRHAFHLAGARAVVSALWAINDRSTLELMEPFMETVCRVNLDKVEALRDAQQRSIRYLRMYRDHAHPFFWAGFTISGN